MDPAAADVLAEIEAAFPACRPYCFTPMTNSGEREEPLLTARDFSDKEDWTQLDSAWLDQSPNGWATALSFLSDQAICFYIPAFIAADLRGELARAELGFHLTHGLDNFSRDYRISPRADRTWTDYARNRWSHLTTAQARAIVHYLEWRIAKEGIDLAYAEQQALSAFWYQRAGVERNGG